MSYSKDRVIRKSEWVKVLDTMKKYNRTVGWVDVVTNPSFSLFEESLQFFDDNPKMNGINAMIVSRCEVELIINTY
jgi:hypothetical protein